MSRKSSNTAIDSNKFLPDDLEDWLWLTVPTFNLFYLHFTLIRREDVDGDGLSLLLLLRPSAWVCWIQCVLHKIGCFPVHFWPLAKRHAREDDVKSKSLPLLSHPSRKQGTLMAMTLIPSLAHSLAMAVVATPSASGVPFRCILYAKWTTLSASSFALIGASDPTKDTKDSRHDQFRILRHMVMFVMTLGLLYDPQNATKSDTSFLLAPGAFILWTLLHRLASQQYHRFFVIKQPSHKKYDDNNIDVDIDIDNVQMQMATWGEYQTLVFIVIIGCLEWQSSLLNVNDHGVGSTNTGSGVATSIAYVYYPLVAQSGVLGCLSSIIAIHLMGSRLSFASKLLLQVAAPLGIVELCLSVQNYTPSTGSSSSTLGVSHYVLPRCFQWLLDFLVSSEPPAAGMSGPGEAWSRFVGVLYWGGALLVLTTPTLFIVQRRQQSVVITRKWFHLVAIILFAPITHFFPQLMALGYAVVLCGLLLLETLRRDAPVLNEFYRLVQDPSKDISEGMILSHICLILGCAMPLWLSQALECSTGEPCGCHQLLSQWGILSLGVGDAMGAVVGKTFGRIRWGSNQRTVEGSLAMWTSMVVVGRAFFVAGIDQRWLPLLVATTFCTLVEAYTIQMDNLVLPLAGSIWLLLLPAK